MEHALNVEVSPQVIKKRRLAKRSSPPDHPRLAAKKPPVTTSSTLESTAPPRKKGRAPKPTTDQGLLEAELAKLLRFTKEGGEPIDWRTAMEFALMRGKFRDLTPAKIGIRTMAHHARALLDGSGVGADLRTHKSGGREVDE